jgi:hypothetical protein
MQLLTGSDGLTRTARVKMNSGISNRAVANLYPLEIINTEPNETVGLPEAKSVNNAKRPICDSAVIARMKIRDQMQ